MSRRIKNLEKESLRLSQALGQRPTAADLAPLARVLDELVELGHAPALRSSAVLHGKQIWILTRWGQVSAGSLSHEEKARVLDHATLGLLTLKAYQESVGKRISQEDLAAVEKYRQQFLRYVSLTRGEQLSQLPPTVRLCGICGKEDPADDYTLSETGMLVCAQCHSYGYGNDPDIMVCPSCGYRFDPGDNRSYYHEFRCAHCGAELEKMAPRI
jgi:hypothetical protein